MLGPVLLIGVVSLLLPLLLGKRNRPSDDAWRGVFYYNQDDPGIAGPKKIWDWLHVEFCQPVVVGRGGSHTRYGSSAIHFFSTYHASFDR